MGKVTIGPWVSATHRSPEESVCELLVVRSGTEFPLMGEYMQDRAGRWHRIDPPVLVEEYVSAYRVISDLG